MDEIKRSVEASFPVHVLSVLPLHGHVDGPIRVAGHLQLV